MSDYGIRALDASTWDAFARLAEKHKGMGFGGCWCTWFHSRVGRPEGEKGRPWKERLVREGNAHAALVFDGDAAVAWAQYGTPDELPNIHHRKEYEATRTDEPPDYRITCIFVDRDYRRTGVAGVALRGALELIAKAGGGRRGGLSAGSAAGQEDFGLVSLQHHAQPLRADRLQLRPAQGQEPLRDAPNGFTRQEASTGARRVTFANPGRTLARRDPPSARARRCRRRRRRPFSRAPAWS